MATSAGPAGGGTAPMTSKRPCTAAARCCALSPRSPKQGIAVSASLRANRHEWSAGSTRTFVVGPHCTVSPPVTTSSWSFGTPRARRQRADSGDDTTVAPVRSATVSTP